MKISQTSIGVDDAEEVIAMNERSSHRVISFVLATGITLAVSTAAFAAPPPAPGGHIPIHFGGANDGGYPALSWTSVPESPADASANALDVITTPNPFSKATVFRFALSNSSEARIRIYSVTGAEVRELRHVAARDGAQEVYWDGRNADNRRVPSGVYLFRVEAGRKATSGKLVFLE